MSVCVVAWTSGKEETEERTACSEEGVIVEEKFSNTSRSVSLLWLAHANKVLSVVPLAMRGASVE